MIAAFMTAGLVLGLTVYAYTTTSDFTTSGAALFSIFVVVFMFGIFSALYQDNVMRIFYCAISIILFSFYLIYDTQLIMGGKTHQLEQDDYILAAMLLYLDIIILFIKLLEILARSK
jgi:FtsH-binding integral membrane protein